MLYYLERKSYLEDFIMSRILKVFLALLVVSACSKQKTEEISIIKEDGSTIVYSVETAENKEQIATGLMNRESMKADSGMIFDLSIIKAPTVMWMKDTLIPLDMLFIDKDGYIYWIYENAQPKSEKLIVAPYPARAVLELNAGDVKKHGINIGDVIKFRYFGPEVNSVVPTEVEIVEVSEELDQDMEEDMEDYDTEELDIEDNGEDEETIIVE